MNESNGRCSTARIKWAAALYLCLMACSSRAHDRISGDVRALKSSQGGSLPPLPLRPLVSRDNPSQQKWSRIPNKREARPHESQPDGDQSTIINQFSRPGTADVDELCRFHGDALPLLSVDPVSIDVHHELFDTSLGLVPALPYGGKKL